MDILEFLFILAQLPQPIINCIMLRERRYSVPVLVRSGLLLPELNIKTQFANDVERDQTNSDSLWVKEQELLPHLGSGLSGGLSLGGHGPLELDWETGVLSGGMRIIFWPREKCLHFYSLHFNAPGHCGLIQDNRN